AMAALRDDMKATIVTMEHFERALQAVKPSVGKEVQQLYEQLEDYFGTARAREITVKKENYFG
ncbi:MAG: hypothetical protein Q8R37_02985, partial [Nanoarchaeota archaeon]|nr:hypothetical protein [Nanoarchaeota archaeon]